MENPIEENPVQITSALDLMSLRYHFLFACPHMRATIPPFYPFCPPPPHFHCRTQSGTSEQTHVASSSSENGKRSGEVHFPSVCHPMKILFHEPDTKTPEMMCIVDGTRVYTYRT